ncbi:MAG: energy transducer TonB [Bacteroidetes bacterium]|nr:energy transducer TonB [Bacteroidota bacterium]
MTENIPYKEMLFMSSGCLTQKALEDMARGSLTGQQFKDVQDHLADCDLCSDALDGVTIWMGKKIPDIELSDRLNQLQNSTQTLIENRRATFTPARRIHGYYRWAALAALFLVFAGIFFLVKENPVLKKESIAMERHKNADSLKIPDQVNLDKNEKTARPADENLNKGPGKLKTRVKFAAPVIKPDVDVVKEQDVFSSDDLALPEKKTEQAASESISESPKAVGGTSVKTASRLVAEEVYEKPFTVVEEMPAFPGGETKMLQFLRENIRYPEQARENSISGTVYVSFVVGKNGNISDIKILRGIGGGCDEEAYRVVKSMPAWIPGKQNGKAVPTQFNMPIIFKLN